MQKEVVVCGDFGMCIVGHVADLHVNPTAAVNGEVQRHDHA